MLVTEFSLAAHVRALSVYGYHHEADERQDERNVDGWHAEEFALVDNRGLERGQNATSEDGHDESGSTKLGVVAQSGERYTIDGGEHERHAGTHADEAVESVYVLQGDDSHYQCAAGDGKKHKQLAGVDVAQEEGTDETRAAEYHHCYDVVLLRYHFGSLLAHSISHEYACAVLDDEGPAHNLNAYIEELCNDAFAIMWYGEDAAQGGQEVYLVVLVAVLGHWPEQNDEEHGEDYESDGEVRTDKHRKVVLLHGLKLFRREIGACGCIERIELGLDEVHSHVHAQQRAHRIERLRQIESACGSLFGSHRQDVGVARCLKKRQTAREDEVGGEERIVLARHLGGIEKESAQSVESQAYEYASLVAEPAYEHGCRERHSEVAAIEDNLHHCAVSCRHAEYLGEGFHHRIGYIVGKAP